MDRPHCRECGDEIEDFMSDEAEHCFACHEFLAEREAHYAQQWEQAMERF